MVIHSKYKGFCSKCHFTIWQNEKIEYNGNAKHLDCLEAIKDKTPRVCDPRYLDVLGKITKKKLKLLLDSSS